MPDNCGGSGASDQDTQAIQGLKSAVAEGKNWYIALLEAIRLWQSPRENYAGRCYQYLVANEAFDWLVLTERLCEELDGLVPERDRANLLFFGIPPVELSKEKFKKLIGASKYRAYLNYFYGILVEKFLLLSVAEEIRKKKRVSGMHSDTGVMDEVYQRIYGVPESTLLRQFRKERHYPQLRSIRACELNEFTYWLFKYRIRTRDKSRVASDTKKALTKLRETLDIKAGPAYLLPSASRGQSAIGR
jgi:hypothetical protein